MVILVNASTLNKNNSINYCNFLKDFFEKLVANFNTHQFVFVVNNNFVDTFNFANNCTTIQLHYNTNNLLQHFYFNNIKMVQIAKKCNATILLQTNAIMSFSKIYQILFVPNTIYLNKKGVKKANLIVCFSQSILTKLTTHYKVEENKINKVAPFVNSTFSPIDYAKALQVKDGFADGREYFLYNATDSSGTNYLPVLKAFSLFKKWQQSNMKLIIACNNLTLQKNILYKLETYKYKNDIILLSDCSESVLAKITAAAYCVLYTPIVDEMAIPVLQAMQSNVPIITSNLESINEITNSSLVNINLNSEKAIAEQMQKIYKDENYRTQLINLGNIQAKNFSPELSINQFINLILKTVS